MHTRFFIIFLLITGLAGCHFFEAPGKNDCEKHIPRDKMIEILTDAYIMEGYLLEKQITRPGVRDSAAHFYKAVFEKHGISQEVFNEALSCYLLDPEDVEIIHEEVLNNLSIKMGEIQSNPNGLRFAPGQVEDIESAAEDTLIQRQEE